MDMQIYVIRHGETAMNLESRLQGWLDEPLNENGILVAQLTGKALRDVHFDRVISSPLSRAKETARLILEENRFPVPVETDERLREIKWGCWEGLCCDPEHFEVPDERFSDFFYDPMRFEGPSDGESIRDVIRRTEAFLRELISDPQNHGKTILVSTHGCAMRALLNMVYENREDFWQGRLPPNCAVSIVKVENGLCRLLAQDKVLYDPSLYHAAYVDPGSPRKR